MSNLNYKPDHSAFDKYKLFVNSKQNYSPKEGIKSALGRHFLLHFNYYSGKGIFDKIKKISDASFSQEEKEKLNKEKEFYCSKINNMLITKEENCKKLNIKIEKEHISTENENRIKQELEEIEHARLWLEDKFDTLNIYCSRMRLRLNDV